MKSNSLRFEKTLEDAKHSQRQGKIVKIKNYQTNLINAIIYLVSIHKWPFHAIPALVAWLEILKIAGLFLRFRSCARLELTRNCLFLDGRYLKGFF
jgi:hypothetical protein